jgi:hypothetical protein
MAAIVPSATDFILAADEAPRRNFWNWSTGAYTHYADDTTRKYTWRIGSSTGKETLPAAALDPDSLVSAGWKITFRGKQIGWSETESEYVEVYEKFGTKTAY